MDILGLDKIRKISDNTDLDTDIKGLEQIRAEDEGINITGLDSIRGIFTNDFPRISVFAMELMKSAARAKELDTELRQYGASRHRYEFAPVAALSDVRSFEQRHGISLPVPYVEFLTQVGNGGAGPELGLYSLEELELRNFFAHSNRSVTCSLAKGEDDYYSYPFAEGGDPFVRSVLSESDWDGAVLELCRLTETGRNSEYEKRRRRLCSGVLQIAECENSFCPALVCGGDMHGEIIGFSYDLGMPEFTGRSFEEWLLGYFDDVINKFRKT